MYIDIRFLRSVVIFFSVFPPPLISVLCQIVSGSRPCAIGEVRARALDNFRKNKQTKRHGRRLAAAAGATGPGVSTS